MLDERRLRRVLEVGRSVVSELDLEALLQRVLEEARELTGARYAALGILDAQRSELERFLTLGIDDETHRQIGALPRGRGVLGVLIDEPQPLRLKDVSDHPRSYGFPLGHPRMTSFLGVPIRVHGGSFGNLYLAEKQAAEEFDEDDEETIVLLASWAGVAISNARAYHGEHDRRQQLEQAVRGLEASTAIARAVGGETDLHRILELIVKRARALVDTRGVLILLCDGDELVVTAIAGQLEGALLDERIPIEGSISGHVLQTRRPERMSNMPDQIRFAMARQLTVSSGLFVPLVFRGRPVGVLNAFDRTSGGEFTADDERLLEGFAASAATAVATAQTVASEGLRKSIAASERERQRWAHELHDETLQELAGLKVMLIGARENRDIDTVHATLDAAIDQIDTEITGLRRLITDLRPAALDTFGVKAALEALAERVTITSGLEIDLDVNLAFESGGAAQRRLVPAQESAIYRLVQEALTNVVKHAAATAVQVSVVEHDGQVEVSVGDDGGGFDPAAATDGFGVLGMRERISLLNGQLDVDSAPGDGTTVHATFAAARVAETDTPATVPRDATG
ncbi:MAG TPA: GAF domain-containing sensor histidine kinase [Conexibacter sp.]|nr:GAF domain-containing sensor histidine kinase [Conexibacter sp.]